MKKLFIALSLAAFALGAQAQYQMANSDFEAWSASSGEPDHWHGFKSAKGNFASFAAGKLAKSSDKRPGSTGSYSAVITSGQFVVVNNGSMTTGQLKADNMQAANPANHAEMDKTSTATDNNDDKFYMPLTGRPDAMKVWLKFTQASANASYPYASVSAVITDGSYYQDPEDKNYTNKMAQAKNAQIATCDWTEISVPFEYLNNSVEPAAILCTFGTNATPGQGSSGDKVFIDDIELVYYSELSAAQYNGTDVAFVDGAATIDAEYNSSLLTLTKKGNGGTIETSIDADGLLTITVKGDNISEDKDNYHTYTIQFNASAPEPAVVSTKTFTEDLYVTLGTSTNDKQVADVTVETLENGNINFVLKNFVLNGMPVGNIAVKNIEVAEDNSFSFNGGIQIAEGDDSTVEMWTGPIITVQCGGSVPLNMTGRFIGEDHVVVYIAIDIADFVGYPVEVHLGYARLESGAMTVFSDAQYGTFCAPFAVEIPEGVKAYTVPSVTGGVLDLNELTGTIPANTPVVLYSELEEGYFSPDLFGVVEEGTPTFGLLTGVYEEGDVPVGSYVLQLKYLDDESYKVGFYKVVEDAPLYIYPNRCYLTVPASGGIKEAFFFNEDDATGIKAMVNGQWSTDNAIYNLAGQRMSKMQKGVNIVNGKKILY